jgi:hypothetical protein
VPAWVKVKLKVAPLLRAGLEKKPLSLVKVCPTESLFVQVTLEPTDTVIDAGSKANPWIFTEEEIAAGVVVADAQAWRAGLLSLRELEEIWTDQ